MWGGTEGARRGLRVPSPPGVIGYVSDYCWYPVSKTLSIPIALVFKGFPSPSPHPCTFPSDKV